MQSRLVTYESATVLTEANAKAPWFHKGESCPQFLFKQQDFCTWAHKETKLRRGALLIYTLLGLFLIL